MPMHPRRKRSTTASQEGWVKWCHTAEAYNTTFIAEFHKRYQTLGCIKGHHLIHEIDKGIAWFIEQMHKVIT
jgi:hypothetical protein